MSSARFADDLLIAREGRQEILTRALRQGRPATVFLSLNIPGADKAPAGSQKLFSSLRAQFSPNFPTSILLEEGGDALGPYAVWGVDEDPGEVKMRCIQLEESSPALRLIDLDVYSAQGVQVDRRSLALSGRSCLLCDSPAVDCMRARRHPIDEVIGKVNELLTSFRA